MNASPENLQQEFTRIKKRQNNRRWMMMGLLATIAVSMGVSPVYAQGAKMAEYALNNSTNLDTDLLAATKNALDRGKTGTVLGTVAFVGSSILMIPVGLQMLWDRRRRVQIESEIEANKPLDASFE